MGLCLSPNNARVSLAVPPVVLPGGASERLHAFWTVCLMPPIVKHSKTQQMRQKLEAQRSGAAAAANAGQQQLAASAAASAAEDDFFLDDRLDNHSTPGEEEAAAPPAEVRGTPHALLDPAKLINLTDDGFRALACLHLVLTDGLGVEALPKQAEEAKEAPQARQQQRHKQAPPSDGPLFRRLRNAVQDSYTLQELLARLPEALGPRHTGAAQAVNQMFQTAAYEEVVPPPAP